MSGSLAALLPGRGRPRAEQAGQVDERILDAAWAVLLEVGPEVLTLDRVAAAARASKQTIYARHEGKRALLHAVLASRISAATAGLDALAEAGTAHAAFLDLLLRAVAAFGQPEKLMLDRVIDWIDAASGDAEARPTRAALADQFCAMMAAHLATAAARWNLVVADPPMAARYWVEGVVGHLRCMAENEAGQGVWADCFTTYFLRGVAGIEAD